VPVADRGAADGPAADRSGAPVEKPSLVDATAPRVAAPRADGTAEAGDATAGPASSDGDGEAAHDRPVPLGGPA
jgi:hypothetical protein